MIDSWALERWCAINRSRSRSVFDSLPSAYQNSILGLCKLQMETLLSFVILLQVLNISSGIGEVATVLRHITFPPSRSAILNLTCLGNQSIQIDFSSFFSVLATKFLSTLVIRSLGLRVSYNFYIHNLKFYLWTTALIQDCFSISQFLSLSYNWSWNGTPRSPTAMRL